MLLALARRLRGDERRLSGQLSRASSTSAIQLGTKYCFTKTFSSEEVQAFLSLTGDTNAIHYDATTALNAGLGKPILPGILCASLFPAVIARNFPGAVYLSQTIKFRKYAEIGGSLSAEVTAQQISGRTVKFDTKCYSAGRDLLIDGEALARLPVQSSMD